MRKLKTLLILMFAASLSLTLFACGSKKNKGSDELYRVEYDDEQITIDDTFGEEEWTAYLETVELEGTTEEGDKVTIKGSECDITGTIDFHTTDRYVTTFTPKNNNENGVDVEIVVVIDHAWGEEEDGVSVCQYAACGATRTAKAEDVAMHYGDFHYGTGVSALGNPNRLSEALPQVALSADDAADLTANDWFYDGATYNAETTNGQVFNNNAGITSADASTRIKAFGSERSGKVVPTLTAGDLTPGMSITIEGFARQDAGTSNTENGGPWNTTNGNWNAPSYGIADAYASTGNAYGYGGGNAVIVRSEGWVLYNGIGQTLNNTLGGVPAEVEGGLAYHIQCGDTEDSNCASLVGATDKILEGQDLENRPAYTSDDWKTWWVYSEGTERRSLIDYQSYTPVRVTWTYRTYKLDPEDPESEKIGIIMIESEYLSEGKSGTMLRSYIKVPNPSRGSYRTIIHGDYSSLIITKSTYVETETVTDMQILDETQEDARTAYLAGETIDAANVFKMEIKSEQNSNWHDGGISVTNDMLYYYKGTGTSYAEAEAAINTADDWEAVGDQPLAETMKYFKVVLTRGDNTYQDMVAENLITITANNVAGAVGDAYGTLDSKDPLAAYTRGIAEIEGTTYVDLTINKAIFRAVPAADTFTGLSDTANYAYATLRILGIEAFSGIESEQQKNGTVESHNYYYKFKADGNDVLLAVAIEKDLLGKALTIEGVQSTDILLTFGDYSVGFGVTSTANYTPFALNVGGDVTITYKNLGTANFALQVFQRDEEGNETAIGSRLRKIDLDGTEASVPQKFEGTDIEVTAYNNAGEDTTVTIHFPAFDFENWTSMPFVQLTGIGSDAGKGTTEDYIEYARTFTATTAEATKAYQSEGNTYFYTADGKLYFASVAKNITTAGQSVDITAITKTGSTVNINDGDETTAKACDLSYAYDGKSAITFANDGYNSIEAYGLRTLLLDKAYGDYGLIVIASIDPAALGFTGDFGFQISGVEQSVEAHYWKYNATDKTIAYEKITTSSGMVVVAPGDCFTAGIVASEVTDGTGKTVFLADYKEVGGRHISDGNGHCKLCGGTFGANTALANGSWFPEGYLNEAIHEGEIIDITGVYETGSYAFDNSISSFIEERGAQGREGGTYCTTLDGYYYWQPFTNWLGTATVPYADVAGYQEGNHAMSNSLITEDHPSNTINGWQNGQDIIIDESNFGAALDGGTFRYTVSYIDGVITTRVRLYDAVGETFIDFVTTLETATNGTYNVLMFFKQGGTAGKLVDDKLTYVRSTAEKSVINNIDTGAATVPGKTYAPSTGINGEVDGATITLSGASAKLAQADAQGNTHYVAFRINFSQALDETTTAVVMNGDAEVTGAYAVLLDGRTAMAVYIPLKAGEAYSTFTIDLTNFAAATLQEDITIDLSNVAVSEVTATPNGADSLNLGEGTFTIEYTNIDGANTLVVNDGTPVALNDIGTSEATALKDGLSVKRGEITGKAVTLTFTKAAANLDAVIPAYVINLKNGDSVIANTQIAAPITIGSVGIEVNQGKSAGTGWYAKAEGTTLYLLTNANANPSTLPLNVNAGHVTLGTANEGIDLLGISDLGYTYTDGAIKFRLTKEVSPLVEHTTGIYTASGSAFLAVLKIDLTSLSIGADTVYGFAIETEGAGYCTVAAARTISRSETAPETAVTLRAATCSLNGVTAKGNGTQADGSDSTYYGLIEYPTASHSWTGEVTDKKGYDTAQSCVNCHAIRYSQSDLTQTWGSGEEAGKYAGWGSNVWEKFAKVEKGGIYMLEGLNVSNEVNRWDMPAIGVAPDTEGEPQGLRLDNYDFLTQYYGLNPQFSNTITDADKTKLDNTTITMTFDYSDSKTIIITAKFVNGTDSFNKTVTVTLTPTEPADVYTLWMHQDGNKFTASSNYEIVPQGKEPSTALTKHVHGNWNEQDRCPEDNVLNPNHGDVSKGGKAHSYDATLHCTICGQLNPEHSSHDYNQNDGATCVCGAVNPSHTHDYENGACKYCSWVQEDVTEAGFTVVTDKNEAITNFNSRWYTVPVQLGADNGLTVGKKLIVVGSQTSAMAENYHAVCWEVLAGYTGRADAYGWNFDPDDSGTGVTAFGTVTNATSITNLGVEDAKGSDIWATFKKIGASANWRVEFNYKDAETFIVTVTVSATTSDAGSLVYNCVYTCPIVNAAMIQQFQTIWIGAENVTNLTVKGYKLV